MKNLTRRNKGLFTALIVGACLVAAALVWMSGSWPQVARRNVQGAIGKRDVLRDAQLSDKDVGVAGTRPLTVDDVRRVVQSPEFKAMAASPDFQIVFSNPAYQGVLTSATFVTLAQDKVVFSHLAHGNVQQVVASTANALTAEQKSFLSSPAVNSALHNSAVQSVLSQPAFVSLAQNANSLSVLSHPAMHEIISSGNISTLATNGQLYQSFVSTK